MQKQLIFCCVFYLTWANPCVAQKGDRGEPAQQNSDASQITQKQLAAINAIAKNHKSGIISLQTIKKEIQGRSDLSGLPANAALTRVMTKIQQDAEKTLLYASANVEAATEKKDSLKQRVEELKQNHDDLKNKLKSEYDTLKAASAYSNQKRGDVSRIVDQEKSAEIFVETASKRKKSAENHLESVRDALRKSQVMH